MSVVMYYSSLFGTTTLSCIQVMPHHGNSLWRTSSPLFSLLCAVMLRSLLWNDLITSSAGSLSYLHISKGMADSACEDYCKIFGSHAAFHVFDVVFILSLFLKLNVSMKGSLINYSSHLKLAFLTGPQSQIFLKWLLFDSWQHIDYVCEKSKSECWICFLI